MDDILILDDDMLSDGSSGEAEELMREPLTPSDPERLYTSNAMPDYDGLLDFEDDESQITSHNVASEPQHQSSEPLDDLGTTNTRKAGASRSCRSSQRTSDGQEPLAGEASDDGDEQREYENVDDEEEDEEEGKVDEEEGKVDEEEGKVDEEEEEEDKKDAAISRIEGLVTNFLEQLANISAVDSDDEALGREGKKIEIKLARRRAPDTDREDSPSTRSLKWPNRRAKGASGLPLARLMGVLNVAHESLVTDLPTTKRDMFYQDVGLFGNQREVNQLTDDLAATFHLNRSDLNIRASGKGLLCGDGLKIVLADGSSVSATNSDPILIPQAEDILRFELNHEIAWVLVVEKEAVFQTLCRLGITKHPLFPGSGIVITGKGYPDVATRQLVATLSHNLPESVPIMAMVDGDAYGLDIASVYKFGSESLKHEAHKLVAERVECIGLFASELEAYGVNEDAMLPTSKADEKKACSMLKRTNLPLRWRDELDRMLSAHRKAEIEVLSATTVVADLGLDGDDTQRSQKRVHPLVHYLSERIAASVAAFDDLQMKVEED